jgi:hypothetical protein
MSIARFQFVDPIRGKKDEVGNEGRKDNGKQKEKAKDARSVTARLSPLPAQALLHQLQLDKLFNVGRVGFRPFRLAIVVGHGSEDYKFNREKTCLL